MHIYSYRGLGLTQRRACHSTVRLLPVTNPSFSNPNTPMPIARLLAVWVLCGSPAGPSPPVVASLWGAPSGSDRLITECVVLHSAHRPALWVLGLYKIFVHAKDFLQQSIILSFPPPHVLLTRLQYYCTSNAQNTTPSRPPCVCHAPYNICNGNIV